MILLLAVIWSLETGRLLPPQPPCQMAPDELIEFWADPQLDIIGTAAGTVTDTSSGARTGAGIARSRAHRAGRP